MPFITVLMSVYNGGSHLRLALDSILKQTYSDFEFLIINDGSTDGSETILQEYAQKDKRIRIVSQSNQGLIAALNHGISLAEGAYIARMDADDISLPERLNLQATYLDDHPKVGIVGSNIIEIDEEGEETGVRSKYPQTDQAIRRQLILSNPFAHPSIMVRRTLLNQTGGYRIFLCAEDYELWFRILRLAQGANLPEYLIKRRIDGYNISVLRRKKMLRSVLEIQFLALKKKYYPWWCVIFCLRTLAAMLVSARTRDRLRKLNQAIS